MCRALWSLQALKEQDVKSKVDAIENKLVAQHEQLEKEQGTRLDVATGNLLAAVQEMNEREMAQFQLQAEQQRQSVLNENAWELRKLLCGQQTVLAKLDVPGFLDGPTVDAPVLQLQSQICKYLHSAFYIRSKLGPSPHEAMLTSQLKKLKTLSSSPVPAGRGGTSPIPATARLSPVPQSYGGGGPPTGLHPMPQHGEEYNSMTMTQQPPTLQPILGPPGNYGYHGGAPGMMQQHGIGQLPVNPTYGNQQYPGQPHQPPPYGGPQQQRYPPQYYR